MALLSPPRLHDPYRSSPYSTKNGSDQPNQPPIGYVLGKDGLVRRNGVHKEAGGSLKLFISHAKLDGVAMARSLIGVLGQLRELAGEQSGFVYFYDDEHIRPGTLWRDVLTAEASPARAPQLSAELVCRKRVVIQSCHPKSSRSSKAKDMAES